MLVMVAALLDGCTMRPEGLNWLPPEAHGSRPDLAVAGGGTTGGTSIVQHGRVIATIPGEGRGGFIYLPPSKGDDR
ncbi:hypothetical protein [Edaphosphingomonas haloaromaticamans]|uniref:Uncharacterized protein n=1 Tax=Edaphosphingomonas haloaromaticamans TaxID=653954 RepID=A0A1S1HA40_9SPHN|nr:hypothetical protein [Sphingomonas haloaromaticamans]OHT19059.1 hypothetical protein BHE75_01041 [Sphingomonas haloaromaticamans]